MRRFDHHQQDRWWLAFPIGTIRKYADDRGSALAGFITLQVFLGLFPLLVVGLTVLGALVEGSRDLRQSVLESTLAQMPVVGDRLRDDVSALQVDTPWVVLSLVGLLWTAAGIYHSLQLGMNQVWNVEGIDRQGFVSRHARALLLFVLLFAAAIGTAFVPDELFSFLPAGGAAADEVFGIAIGVALLLGVFRIVLSPSVPSRQLVPAAILAGLLWNLLQRLGGWLVVDRLTRSEDLYGSIALVVVAVSWINLLARALVLANEWAVVSWRHLWPRRLAQPPLSAADQRVLAGLVHNERRRPEQHIDVSFDDGDPVP